MGDLGQIQPLTYPEHWQERSSWEQRLSWVPLLGTALALEGDWCRCRRAERAIRDVLEHRPDIPLEVWGSDKRAAVAMKIGEFCAKEYSTKPNRFIPDDPFDIACQWRTGDLSEIETLMDIEDVYGLHLTDDDTLKQLMQMTFGEVVDFIIAHGAHQNVV